VLKRYAAVKEMVRKYLLQDQQGATAIEYGLIAGLIAAVLVTVLRTTGTTLASIFTKIEAAIKLAAGP